MYVLHVYVNLTSFQDSKQNVGARGRLYLQSNVLRLLMFMSERVIVKNMVWDGYACCLLEQGLHFPV